MTTLQHPIGILGGTFDPIHMGHLRFALEAYDQLKLAKVHLVPCFQPVHRRLPEVSADSRFNMVSLAIANEPALYADPREIHMKKPCFTIDTLEAMRHEKPHTPLCLLIGSDVFSEFTTWHRFKDILTVAHIIVGHRPVFQVPDQGDLAEWLQAHQCTDITHIHRQMAGSIILLPIPALDISASAIRKRIAEGHNPRYLLPDAVYHDIQQQGTYRS